MLISMNIMPFGKHGFDLDDYKIYCHHFKKDNSSCRVSHLFSNNMDSLSFLFIKHYRTYYRNIHSIYKRKGSYYRYLFWKV